MKRRLTSEQSVTNVMLTEQLNSPGSLLSWLSPFVRFFQDHRKEFLIVFSVNLLAYFVYITHFLHHNHTPRFPWFDLNDQVFAGRWFTPVIFAINQGANIPVLTPLLSIFLTIVSGMLAIHLWNPKIRCSKYIFVVLIITLYPAFLGAYYWSYASMMFPSSLILSVAALLIASRLSTIRVLVASVAVTLALATNQPALSTLVAVFMAYRYLIQ
jgi:hypothetical protein